MKSPDLARWITRFFRIHLAAERSVSRNTVVAYRDALKFFLRFAADFHKSKVECLVIENLSAEVVLKFLEDLETTRKNTAQTRNARLAAIHCFFRYVLDCEPALATFCQRILTIPTKKTNRPILGYLSGEELEHILNQVKRSTRRGQRDYLLLTLLYDTGTRVQEILDIKPSDIRLSSPSFIRVVGKGRKERLCPLLPQTNRLVKQFLEKEGRSLEDNECLFQNQRGEKLTRQGVRYIFRKYLNRAVETMPSLSRRSISPHTLRHTKAMHLLQSGVPIITIKDILGHADIKSTEIYIQTDLEAKRKALEKVGTLVQAKYRLRGCKPNLLSWLESL